LKESLLTIFSQENDFFKLTNSAKRLPSIWLSSFLLPVLFVVLSGLLTQYVLSPLYFGDPKGASSFARQAFGLYALFGSIILLIFIWMRTFEGRWPSSIGFTKPKFIKRYAYGFLIGIGMNFTVVGLIAVFGSVNFETSIINPTGIAAISGVTIMLFGFVIQGASEEILARGWMFQVIGARYKPWIGAIVTSVFFSLLHLGNSGINIVAVFNLVLFALLMVLFVMKDGSLWSACAWHTSWNWTLGNVLGLSVSGTGEKVSLFNLSTSGHDLITGGGFGPEGSLITTTVLIVAVGLTSAIILRNSKNKIDEEVIHNDDIQISVDEI